jgi:hypothetical protein
LRLYPEKLLKSLRARGMTQVVEHLLSKHEALSSISVTNHKNNQRYCSAAGFEQDFCRAGGLEN